MLYFSLMIRYIWKTPGGPFDCKLELLQGIAVLFIPLVTW